MKAAALVLAIMVAGVWATVRGVQWAMVNALRIGALGLALWFMGLAMREVMKL